MGNKKITLLVLAVLVFAFSGCSLGPVKNTSSTGTQKYSVSKSFWKSEDGGKTWIAKDQSSNSPTESDMDVLSLEINPLNADDVLLGLRTGGIVRTENGDGALNFSKFKLEKVYGVSFDPSNQKTIYATALFEGRGKIVKTIDGGENWDDVYSFPSDGPVVIVLVQVKNVSGTLYASTSDNQVIKSTDGGASWKNIYKANSPVIKIAVDAASGQTVYLLTQGGEVFQSSNSGNSFDSLSQNISLSKMQTSGYSVLETDPTLSKTVYLGGKTGMIRSRDGGKSWERVVILNNPESSPVRALAINPQNSNELIYGAGEATFKSIDGGNTWTTFQFNVGKLINVIKYSKANPNIVYLGFSNK